MWSTSFFNIRFRNNKNKKWQKHKGNTRIEYLVGNRAFNDYLKVDNFSNDICKYLSCGKDDVINTINNLLNHIKELSDENKSLNIKLSDYQIVEMLESSEKIKDISIIKNIYKDTDMKSLIRLADRITERSKAIVLFALVQDDKANMIFKSSVQVKDISMNDLLKDAISLIDGRRQDEVIIKLKAVERIIVILNLQWNMQ